MAGLGVAEIKAVLEVRVTERTQYGTIEHATRDGVDLGQFLTEWTMLDYAIHLAVGAHYGQVDKGGKPYLWHALRVGMSLLPDAEAATVGVLHDVFEDGSEIWKLRVESSMPKRIVGAILRLTRGEGEDYIDYIRAVGQDELATRVKLADLADNLRYDRLAAAVIAGVDQEAVDLMQRRYLTARYELQKIIAMRLAGDKVGRDG